MTADMLPPGGRPVARPKVGRPPLEWREKETAAAVPEPAILESEEVEGISGIPFAANRMRGWEPRFALLLFAVIIITNAWMHNLLQNDGVSIHRVPPTEMGANGALLLSPAVAFPLPLLARDVE